MESWRKIESMDDLNAAVEDSVNQPIVLFKHSTRCGISSAAKNRLESETASVQDKATIYYLDLLEQRPISNEIAQRFQVTHQSPQIVVVKNVKAVLNASHEGVSVDAIRSVLN